MPKGKFIVFSGGEGSGKTTVIQRLLAELPQLKTVAFPGGNEYGQHVRQLVKSGQFPLDPEAILLLIWSNFSDTTKKMIRAELDTGQNFLLDRFTPDSYAYQGKEIFPSPQAFFQLHQWVGLPAIDFWGWFDVDPQTGLNRRQQDGNVDVFDAKELAFHQHVRAAFAQIFNEDIPQIRQKGRIDADQDSETVYQDVRWQLLPMLSA